MKNTHKSKNFFRIGRKLQFLMVLEIMLVVSAYLSIIFYNDKNLQLQQNTRIYQLNHTLLLQTNSALEKLDTSSNFPLAHIADRYHDPLLIYLTRKNHGGISETEFYKIFYNRTSEISIQYPDIESVLLFDSKGNLLDSKTTYNQYIPIQNYNFGSWYQKSLDLDGKIYFLSNEEISDLKVRRTTQNLYGSRVIYDYLTGQPICITLIGIRVPDIPISFETKKSFDEQQYCLYDAYGQKIYGNTDFPVNLDALQTSRSGDYYYKQFENGTDYLYHISYSTKNGGIYSIIHTPYKLLLQERINKILWIVILGIAIILLNITIFNGIILSINRPLIRLIHMCEEIGKGNFNVCVSPSQNDELSYLTNSLNAMALQIQELIQEVYIKNITKRDLELQMLRSQINPHFLYNTLENMRMSAYTKGYGELSEMCLLLSKVLRYGVTNSSKLVTVQEELIHLNDYISLLHYCFPNLKVNICVDQNLWKYHMIKVLFQPLIENSVNHAASTPPKTIQIQIWGYEEAEDIVFVVSDNGNGIEKEQLEEIRSSLEKEEQSNQGIGLKNIHRRLRLYYGENYGLVINSSPGRGTSVTARLPKKDT